jgi:hypothetical protein
MGLGEMQKELEVLIKTTFNTHRVYTKFQKGNLIKVDGYQKMRLYLSQQELGKMHLRTELSKET